MWNSRKWRAVLCDAVFGIVVLSLATWLGDPKWQEFSLKLVALIQAPVVMYILGTAVEDAAAKSAVVYFDEPLLDASTVGNKETGTVGPPTTPYPGSVTSTNEGPG